LPELPKLTIFSSAQQLALQQLAPVDWPRAAASAAAPQWRSRSAAIYGEIYGISSRFGCQERYSMGFTLEVDHFHIPQ